MACTTGQAWKEGLSQNVLNKIYVLEQSVEKLDKDVKQKQFNVESTQNEKASLQLKFNELKTQHKTLEGESRGTTSKLLALQQTYDQLKRDLQSKEDQRECLSSRFDVINDKNKRFTKEVTKLENVVEDLQIKLAASICDVNRIKENHDKLREDKTTADYQVKELKAKLDHTDKQAKQMESDIELERRKFDESSLKAKVDSDKAIKQAKDELERHHQLQNALTSDYQKTMDVLRTDLADARKTIVDMKKFQEEREDQIAERESTTKCLISKSEDAARECATKLEEQIKKLMAMENKYNMLEKDYARVKGESTQGAEMLTVEISAMKGIIDQMELDKNEKSKSEIEGFETITNQLAKEVGLRTAIKSELEELREMHKDTTAELTRTTVALREIEQKELETTASTATRVKELEIERDSLQSTIESTQEELKAARLAKDGMVDPLNDANGFDISDIRKERDDALSQLEKAQNEMAQVISQLTVLRDAVVQNETLTKDLLADMQKATVGEKQTNMALQNELEKTNSLQTRVTELEQDIESLKECLEGEGAECERLQGALTSTEKKMMDIKLMNESILAEKENEYDNLQKKCMEFSATIAEMKKTEEKQALAAVRVTELSQRLEQEEAKTNQLESDLIIAVSSTQDLNATLTRMKKEMNNIEEKTKSELLCVIQKNEELSTNIERLTSELQIATKDSKEINILQAENVRLENMNERLSAQMVDVNCTKDANNALNAQLREMEDVTKRKNELGEKAKESQSQFDHLTRSHAILAECLFKAEQQITNSDIPTQVEEMAATKKQLDVLTEKFEKQEIKYMALITTTKNLERSNNVLKAKLSAIKKKANGEAQAFPLPPTNTQNKVLNPSQIDENTPVNNTTFVPQDENDPITIQSGVKRPVCEPTTQLGLVDAKKARPLTRKPFGELS
eukprot:CFRG3777T1